MPGTTRKQLESILTALCRAANLPRAESPGAVGVFLEKGLGGYSIRMKHANGTESDAFGSLGLCEPAGVLWRRMSFALSVIGAGEHHNRKAA